MRRLLALVLAISLWATGASAASAYNLVPCSESPAFQARAEYARPTTGDPESGKKRFERYSQALCGEDGLPHLIVDGSLNRAGDFLIPSILFLYITGWIGWAGRSYLQAIKSGKNPEEKEIVIDVPLAIQKMLGAALWPVLALGEFTSGKMFAEENEITVSPR
ncbi:MULTISPECIES: Photosystem I reaction center subunit III [Okeania]|uniref:Photosystem I reaction center subunit III n=1 Tax=Okeania hirsuta TaxID=1458930 RepID=A0A3N6NYK0_9CYAN|nr:MULTISPECIES: Photosystem I reaction center subunit III [Okeania]NET12107.1 Photosystem I reaction center subunit III [Okeania sp. SIO1H6]NES77850.1 Photosystem I reaction center subunit III [Okeania sp. SIO1H4]NES93219.1 Photosystem I reaction center subunit III [Okeania sp. SIO2B9]NET22679.1 Photosystem I reaction center subunit III [Okeania sp. SIO1H5]NET79575.1 Photosystem I reaction center subunit III [Okeania sp. SIO1F9]